MTCKPEGTHHHACACREEVFRGLVEAAKTLERMLGLPPGHITSKELSEITQARNAITKAESDL